MGLMPGELIADLYKEQLGHPPDPSLSPSSKLAEFWSYTLNRKWVRDNTVETSISGSAHGRKETDTENW